MTPRGRISTLTDGSVWEDITRYDRLVRQAGEPLGWSIPRLRGTMVIESRGNPEAVQRNDSNGWSYGLFQVVPYGVGWNGWHSLVRDKAGLSANATRQQVIDALYDAEVNTNVAVAILESLDQQYGTSDRASSAFFLGNPDWRGNDTVNGTSGLTYRDTLNKLIKEQEAFAPPDIISAIVSGAKYTANFGFNMPNIDINGVPQNYYHYGVGHGTNAAHMHTGLDIVVPLRTPIKTPLSGVVRCVGNAGSGDWGQGCGAFRDDFLGGPGNITIMSDAGYKLTFGHMGGSNVRVGERVSAWQNIGVSGGMVGPHIHLDVTENRGGSYWLLDPIPTIARALGQQVPPPPPTYATPRPVPQPGDFDTNATVIATTDNVPVLQRADRSSAATNKPLAKGDDFSSSLMARGNDGKWYWISSRGSRVPIEDTNVAEVLGIESEQVTCPPVPDLSWATDAIDTLEDYERVLTELRRNLELVETS
jgi:murein DD-endopeptidase MepM/ murein hydrolase activator NlpD